MEEKYLSIKFFCLRGWGYLEFSQKLLRLTGALTCGILPFSWLLESMTDQMKIKYRKVCPWAETVFSFTFCYEKEAEGNLAAFARGRDYHSVIRECLEPACRELAQEFSGNRFCIFADDAPFSEVLAAAFSGAGMLGKNGLILCPPYGNHVLLGEIVTDMAIHYPYEKKIRTCINCSRCISACPTGAMQMRDGRRVLDRSKCISAITQKKGGLNREETERLEKSEYIWGCDRCINACPENREPVTRLLFGNPENRIDSLSIEDLEGLSDDEFKNKYRDRAFTWKGAKPLLRNLFVQKNR